MRPIIRLLAFASSFLAPFAASLAAAAAPATQPIDMDLRAAKDDNKRYFLMGPSGAVKSPDKGYGLLIILPGGDGSADFKPFCQRIADNALPDGYLVAQLVSVQWAPNQPITWPWSTNRIPQQKFTVEEFIDAVVQDVRRQHKLDDTRIFALGWSSGGPPLYAMTLRKNTPLKGAFIAMSVFNPRLLPPLDAAKGKAYYIYHSPQDPTCPYRMAKDAHAQLTKRGAKATLVDYQGGHGWHGDVFTNIRAGVEWLEQQAK